MAVFQRRLASSTYALKRSFERRAEKLSAAIKAIEENGLEAVRQGAAGAQKKAENNELDLFDEHDRRRRCRRRRGGGTRQAKQRRSARWSPRTSPT